MDYQLIGFVFACIGAAMSVAYLALGVSLLKVVRKSHSQPTRSRTTDAE